MIYINKGEVNSIVLTLSEVSTLPSPYYLFVFQNEMNPTSDPILFTNLDESPYPERFNLFYLDEPVDVELMKGQYTYSVFNPLASWNSLSFELVGMLSIFGNCSCELAKNAAVLPAFCAPLSLSMVWRNTFFSSSDCGRFGNMIANDGKIEF